MSTSAPSSSSPSGPTIQRDPVFATTHWSVVQTAGRPDTSRSAVALEKLCRTYWYPLYAYARRRGQSPADAQDSTQAFFARLLERNWVGDARRERGRFRTFLLTAMNRFLADEWDKLRAQKRGGGRLLVPLQLDTAETRYGQEPADTRTPEQAFDRRWALALLDTVLHRLREEYETAGRGEIFARLHGCLIGGRDSQPYADLATRVNLTEGAVKVAVHRLRKRYRELLRLEIAQTLAADDDVEDELRHLFKVLAG